MGADATNSRGLLYLAVANFRKPGQAAVETRCPFWFTELRVIAKHHDLAAG